MSTEVKPVERDVARKKLNQGRDNLIAAVDRLNETTNRLTSLIIEYRPSGLLTVGEMAEAVGRDRSYIDSVWSTSGDTVKGKQTRVTVDNPDAESARLAYDTLVEAAKNLKIAADDVDQARDVRNRMVSEAYSSKVLGPTQIARHAGIDRNHVHRIARKSGIGPVHRVGVRNQHTA